MNRFSFRSPIGKAVALILVFGVIVLLQFEYDTSVAGRPPVPPGSHAVSPFMIHLVDLGFHPAVGAFLWANTMPEILDLFFNGHTEYFSDLSYLFAVEPKFSYPYAFSVLTLPAVSSRAYKAGVDDAMAIGKQGLAQADPDWRIPYYMAMNYYLSLHDAKDAIQYFDLAARTPGAPQFAIRFSLNFSVGSNQRSTAEELWTTIRDSTNDQFEKDRAQEYIDHLHALDYLDAASKAYKNEFGKYPTSTDALVGKGIIPSVPQDPFGFTFIIQANGTAGVDLAKLPGYILAEPQQ